MAVDGVAKHQSDLRVEILVVVPAGESARAATDRALEWQAAAQAPGVQSSGYTLNRLYWEQLPVVQSYNPSGEPTAAAGSALTNTYAPWSSVPGSTYRITSGGTTTRCPSWSTGCAQVPGAFDAQTVYLHENGHVAGLGQSSDPRP